MTHTNDPNQVCILWHAPDQSPKDSLINALTKRELSVLPTASKHTAFAAACRCAKVSKRVVIVLDDQDSLVDVERVLSAMERFCPEVICWVHTEGANPPIVPVVRTVDEVESDSIRSESSAVVQSAQSRSVPSRSTGSSTTDSPSASPLRLVGTKPSVESKAPINTRDVLDADELDALLAGEMGDGKRGK